MFYTDQIRDFTSQVGFVITILIWCKYSFVEVRENSIISEQNVSNPCFLDDCRTSVFVCDLKESWFAIGQLIPSLALSYNSFNVCSARVGS